MISKKYKFIFVQINKTGNTSVRKTLLPESPRENNHQFITYYKKRFPKEFDSYFKFTFVRNPYDKVISQYFFRKKFDVQSSKNMTFNEFIRNPVGRPLQNQLDWITINNRVMVDFIGRFERLQQDFNKICDILEIERKPLIHLNKSDHEHYSRYYDDESRQIVEKIFAKDFEYFNYKFEKF